MAQRITADSPIRFNYSEPNECNRQPHTIVTLRMSRQQLADITFACELAAAQLSQSGGKLAERIKQQCNRMYEINADVPPEDPA